MATPSSMLPLGTRAPDFTLTDTISGRSLGLSQLKSVRATVVMFICNHCPYVKHLQRALVQLARDYQPRGVAFVAISSNDVTRYPEDGPAQMKKAAAEFGYPFPYLYDETQVVATAFSAACTPDFYVFDGSLSLVYRGQFDDSRPGNRKPVTGDDIRAALDAVLSNRAVNPEQKPSIGCSIKWREA